MLLDEDPSMLVLLDDDPIEPIEDDEEMPGHEETSLPSFVHTSDVTILSPLTVLMCLLHLQWLEDEDDEE